MLTASKEKGHRQAKKKVEKALAEVYAERAAYRYLGIFYSVFNKYKTGMGRLGVVPTVKVARNPGAVPSGRASGRCKPTAIDFIADVELAVKKVLNGNQIRTFRKMVEMASVPDEERYHIVANTVGKELLRRGIFPLDVYFADTYVVPNERRKK